VRTSAHDRNLLSEAKADLVRGFTLVELLVVIALIAGLTALLLGNSNGGGTTTAQESAQSALAGLVTVARTKAISSGQASRVLLNIDPTSSLTTTRYLRYLVAQTQVAGTWQTVTDLSLPDGAFVVPGDFAPLPTGLFAEGAGAWVKSDGVTALRSTVLRSSQISIETVNASVAEKWVSFSISGVGSTSQSGDLVIAQGRARAPTTYAVGASPVELVNRDSMCGLTLSAYGLTVLIRDRSGF